MIRKAATILFCLVFFMAALYGCRTTRPVSGGDVSSAPTSSLWDYDTVLVQDFEVPANFPAPQDVGSVIAGKVVFQIQRYSQTYKLFNTITKDEGKMPASGGSKILVINGDVREYTLPSIGKRIGRSFIPGGEFTGTAAFAAHYQFIEKSTGKIIYETDLRTTSTGNADTVDYAMERNAEAAARVVYQHKVGK